MIDQVKRKKRIIGIVIGLLILATALYWLSDLIIYILVAFLISMLGRPLVKFLNKRMSFPPAIASIVSLVLIIGVISGICWLIFPMFINQIQQLSKLDYAQIANQSSGWIDNFIAWLSEKNIHIAREQINTYIAQTANQIWRAINIEGLLVNIVSKVSAISVAIFSIIFISFFFLRDEKLFKKIVFLFIPDRQVNRVENVIQSSEYLLTRYFIGLSVEMICMMTILSVGLWAFGIQNALLYGCIGGFLNIIPYIGPVIGAVLTCIVTLLNNIDLGLSMDMFWLLIKVVGVFVGGNMIDNMLLQTFIYSTSVKAHPLEIFLVILIAGNLIGIWGMILAIPCYTVLRIFAKEFFKDTKVVRELTRNI